MSQDDESRPHVSIALGCEWCQQFPINPPWIGILTGTNGKWLYYCGDVCAEAHWTDAYHLTNPFLVGQACKIVTEVCV